MKKGAWTIDMAKKFQWIKLTEYLPKTNGDYLLTVHERYSYGTDHEVDVVRTVCAFFTRFASGAVKWTFRDYFNEEYDYDDEHEDYEEDFIKLTAWAEMPAPYTE